VKLLAPDLFERRFSGLMDLGRARLPELAPEWTDHNAHDPGITLMELLAWVAEAQLYSLARRPRRDERTAYAALFGLTAGGTTSARGLIWPDHRDPQTPVATFVQSVVIPPEAVIHVVNEETPTFRPADKLLLVPGRIVRLESRLGNGPVIDQTVANERGGTALRPFDVLTMTFRCNGDAGLFAGAKRRDAKGARLAIGVRAAGGPVESAKVCHSSLAATLLKDNRRVPLRIVSDTTNGLLSTGALLLDLDAIPDSPAELTIELRSRNGFDRPPRLLRIEPNVIPIRQGRFVERELHPATGVPDWNFELNVPGLRFAPGDEPVKIEVGPDEWRRCEHLSDSAPGEAVFELDAAKEKVTFGNGINGGIPPQDAQVLASYAVSDGAEGNVARNRPWRVAQFARPFGTNLDPVTGGAAAFGWIEERREARRLLREEHALVSSDDIEKAAEALPLLEVARAFVVPRDENAPRTGVVTLVVMSSQPPEGRRFLEAVRRLLAPRMPLGTRLAVTAPSYADFTVDATLLAEAGRDPETIRKVVEKELQRRLDPLQRKPGVPVTQRDLAAWVRTVDGVQRVVELHTTPREIKIPRGGLPRLDLGRSTINIQRAARSAS
jgi:predicted phage baseplate assembly protein